MDKVTVTIITLNEERNIRGCLESVKWADEVVVSDSGSTDDTVKACESFGARVYADDWHGFGRQKNLCAERANNPWVLNIDADERVTPELAEEIMDVLVNPRKPGYFIPRKNYFSGQWVRHCGWWPDYNLRLYKRSEARFGERLVHESVEMEGQAGYLANPLEHYTYRDISDYLKRMERYSTLAAEQMKGSGRAATLADLVLRPPFTFLKMYFLRRGFLDGGTGLVLSTLYSFYTFTKYAKLREMERSSKDAPE